MNERLLEVIFFFYGLAFISLGIVIITQVRASKGSKLRLINVISLLAFFGIAHGFNEFIDMFKIIWGKGTILDIVGPVVLILSFIFLFWFGFRLINIDKMRLGLWFPAIIALAFFSLPLLGGLTKPDMWTASARYFLG
ncbi:MAG: hypothetical protein Q8L35_02745, partial [Actinomycetota bacterium]|nr:hypothetical protein [Actinomycetota bacterium]